MMNKLQYVIEHHFTKNHKKQGKWSRAWRHFWMTLHCLILKINATIKDKICPNGFTFIGLFPGVNFINVLRVRFLSKISAPKITNLCFGFEIFWRQNIGEKRTCKMLMKLTPGLKKKVEWVEPFMLSFFPFNQLNKRVERTI
jgi:hypothetical protein